jgi:hypothetical protein
MQVCQTRAVAASEFVVARNPDATSSLPYLIRIPLGPDGVVLKARDRWPRTAKVFCHPQTQWPADVEIVERVPVRSCVRRGAAIDLVLDRSRENRSQIVFTRIRGGREAIFWQTARTTKQARPNVGLPTQRSAGGRLQILVDHRERYPWSFNHQQADTERRPLPAGDYGVELDGELLAVVERKSVIDLAASVTSGRLRYLMTDLASLHRAAVVVEDRYSAIFRLDHVRPAIVAGALAEAQVRVPTVPIVFAETRALAQEWTYRFLGAALAHLADGAVADQLVDRLEPAGPVPVAAPTAAEVREWARSHGVVVNERGVVPRSVWERYTEAQEGL